MECASAKGGEAALVSSTGMDLHFALSNSERGCFQPTSTCADKVCQPLNKGCRLAGTSEPIPYRNTPIILYKGSLIFSLTGASSLWGGILTRHSKSQNLLEESYTPCVWGRCDHHCLHQALSKCFAVVRVIWRLKRLQEALPEFPNTKTCSQFAKS